MQVLMMMMMMMIIIMIVITNIPIIVGSLGCVKSNLDKELKDLSIEAECRSHTQS